MLKYDLNVYKLHRELGCSDSENGNLVDACPICSINETVQLDRTTSYKAQS